MGNRSGCLICGKPLEYYDTEREMTCAICGKRFPSAAGCVDGHYICDRCHAKQGIETILAYCRKSDSKNPITMVQGMMDDPFIYMHGNEHHIMVGAALISAYHNAGGKVELEAALREMEARGGKYPGGACGFWGCRGAAVSAGMFWSIVTGTTPLSGKTWGLANQITAGALQEIGMSGGPRCCKRNSFTAICTAAAFVKENLGIDMELPEKIECRYFMDNQQCIRNKCPYYVKPE